MARQFNGSSDRIDLTMSADDTSAQIAVSAWIKTSAAAGTIFASDNGSGAGRVIQFRVAANVLSCILFSGGTAHTVASAGTVNNNVWRHVMSSYDGTTQRNYIDGALDGTLTASNNGVLTSKSARIGSQIPGVTNTFFNGGIADVAIFYGLTSAQSLAAAIGMAAGLPAAEFGPSHYWPLWGVDSPEPDIGNG